MKEKNIISWDDWFMGLAILSSKLSPRKNKNFNGGGACIVNTDNIIVGLGYNVYLGKDEEDILHGVKVAILDSKHGLKDSSLYTKTFPCHECAKIIAQKRLKKVYYLKQFDENNESLVASRIILQNAGIETIQLIPNQKKIIIDFGMYDSDEYPQNSLFESIKDKIIKYWLKVTRKDEFTWNEYGMSIAIMAAQRSKDPSTKVGSCITSQDQRILGVGYNGFTRVKSGQNDEVFSWKKSEIFLENRNTYVAHSEPNSMVNSAGNIEEGILFVGLFPCNECGKMVIRKKLSIIYYLSDRNKHNAYFKKGVRMLKKAGVKVRKFRTNRDKIVIDFNYEKRN